MIPTRFAVASFLGLLVLWLLLFYLYHPKETPLDASSKQEAATLKKALAEELTEVANKMRTPPPPPDLPNALTFDFGTIDLPIYSSILTSGKIFLLDDKLVRALNDLSQEIQDRNRANEDLRSGLRSLSTQEARSHLGEFNRIMLNPDAPTEDPLVGFMKTSLLKRKAITLKIPVIQTELGRES